MQPVAYVHLCAMEQDGLFINSLICICFSYQYVSYSRGTVLDAAFISLFLCFFGSLFVCLFVCLFACLLACLLVCLLACLLACLFVCLFVCLLLLCHMAWRNPRALLRFYQIVARLHMVTVQTRFVLRYGFESLLRLLNIAESTFV